MNITIYIPDDKVTALVNAFGFLFNYQATISDGLGGTIPNPQTKAQFARGKINDYIKEVYINAQIQNVDAQKVAVRTTAVTDSATITTT